MKDYNRLSFFEIIIQGQLMLYKDQILVQVIKKQDEMERAEVMKDSKSDLNILLELSETKYEVCNHIWLC